MQLKFYTFPVLSASVEEEAVNKFLRSVKVLEIKRELVLVGDNTFWSRCILYIPNANGDIQAGAMRGKTDYKDILTEEQFVRFCQFRKARKIIADEEAIPAFAVFTDYELSEISKMLEINVSSLKKISGIGSKKIEKYGVRFCELIKTHADEEGGESV